MSCSSVVGALCGLLLSVSLVLGCTSQDVNLRARIVASNASATNCGTHSDCIGPSILAVEDGFWLTTVTNGTPHPVKVETTRLRQALTALPVNAWVRGPEIVIAPTDDVSDGGAVNRNLEEAERICRALGLDVHRRLGG